MEMLFKRIEMDGQERIAMRYNIPEAGKNTCQFRIVDGEESSDADEVQMDLQQKREEIEKQNGIEDYWAGRNLADRNSAQWAA